MNNKVGVISAITVSITVLLFAIGMIIGQSSMSYFVCIILSWGYVTLSCAFYAKASTSHKVFALAGVAFAIFYAVIIDIVYFTQLTTVLHKSASEEILQVLSYEHLGSLMFNLNLFGYGIMALSTFMIGMAIIPNTKSDKWLKALLLIHGVFVIPCVILPMLNVFGTMGAGGDIIGVLVLIVWCAYFLPVGILSWVHFKMCPSDL
jgi:hypothetical protein